MGLLWYLINCYDDLKFHSRLRKVKISSLKRWERNLTKVTVLLVQRGIVGLVNVKIAVSVIYVSTIILGCQMLT